jgi:HD-like signal output (HDOD) protein
MALKFRRKKVDDPAAGLREVLGPNTELPTFPTTVIKALEALRDSDSSAKDVATVVGADPGLTVRLLKLVNSAGFGPAKPVNSVDQAVAVAGFGAVESLVLSVGVNAALPDIAVDGFDQTRFWRTASRRATTARAFAGELHPASASLSFTAGLLQDMAVPLIAGARPDYGPILRAWHEGGEDLDQLEGSTFEWNHGSIAEMLCGQWELPSALATAIGGHHGGTEDDEVPPGVLLAAPIREGDRPDVIEAIMATACEKYGMTTDGVVELLARAETEAVEVASLFV